MCAPGEVFLDSSPLSSSQTFQVGLSAASTLGPWNVLPPRPCARFLMLESSAWGPWRPSPPALVFHRRGRAGAGQRAGLQAWGSSLAPAPPGPSFLFPPCAGDSSLYQLLPQQLFFSEPVIALRPLQSNFYVIISLSSRNSKLRKGGSEFISALPQGLSGSL